MHCFSICSEVISQKPVARLGTWAGLLFGHGVAQEEKIEWTMNYLHFSPNSLLLVFSDNKELIGMFHLDRCTSVEGYDAKSEHLQGMGIIKLNCAFRSPIVTFNDASACFILLASIALQKLWLNHLQVAIEEQTHG